MWFESARRGLGRISRPVREAAAYLVQGGWKRRLLTLVFITGLFTGSALLYAWSGLILIGASSDHWGVTSWYLHFVMRSAVRTHALGIKVPPLDDPAMVLKGAGHYATGCAPCHGAPGETPSLIARNMVPQPPRLSAKIPEWSPAELFWIVKHGIKFTAMPAWPAQQRDDEVWAMVTFLRELPDLAPGEYRRLAYGETGGGDVIPAATPAGLDRLDDPPGPILENCIRCHGRDGAGRQNGAFPSLAGQSEAYLLGSLEAYATGDRYSGVMQSVAAGLEDPAMRELAAYYAGKPARYVRDVSGAFEEETIRRGEIIADKGLPRQGIPSCVHCHGPGEGPRNPHYPEIRGQYADYLALQLTLFRDGHRGGSAYARLMHATARYLDQAQIRALAAYYASLEPDLP